MEKFTIHQGVVAVLNQVNIDTDQIIPKQFLKFIGKTGFGKYLFFDWRFLDNGQLNPNFELNQAKYKNASILISGANFGCGSSREHAPWSLLDYGFKVIIAPSFADIFYNNCFKNSMLPIILPAIQIDQLIKALSPQQATSFTIDLGLQKILFGDFQSMNFDINAQRKKNLVEGVDDIEHTLKYSNKIESFEQQQKQQQPWLWY